MKTPFETRNLHNEWEEGFVFPFKGRRLRYESLQCLNQSNIPNGFEF